MKSVKEEALKAISSLPEDTPLDDIMYRLYVIDKVRQGQDAIVKGKTMTTHELMKEIESW